VSRNGWVYVSRNGREYLPSAGVYRDMQYLIVGVLIGCVILLLDC
jgi:hypothetical protein